LCVGGLIKEDLLFLFR